MLHWFEDALSKIINDYITSMLTVGTSSNITATIVDKYNISVIIGNSLLAITLVYAIIGFKFSMDIFDVSKTKNIFKDLLVAGFLLNGFAFFFIGKAIDLANIIKDVWYGNTVGNSGTIVGEILTSIGAVGAGAVVTVNPGLGIGVLLTLGLVVFFFAIFSITHIILISITDIITIILPVLLGFYPTKLGKQFLQKWLSVFIGLMSIAPVQALALSLLFTPLPAGAAPSVLNFSSTMECLGKLIVVVLIVPGAMFYMLSVAGNANIVN